MDAEREKIFDDIERLMKSAAAKMSEEDRWQLVGRMPVVTGEIRLTIGDETPPPADVETDAYLEHARQEMFPKMRESALSLMILGEPDPKLALELGAAILFDKPIILTVPAGVKVPLSLKTIATKIVELEGDPQSPVNYGKMKAAIDDVVKTLPFRQKAGR